MEREEVRQILSDLRTAYPQSFINHTKKSATLLMDLWYQIFKNTPASLVTMAVYDIIAHDSRDFAPNPGQVNNRIKDLITDTPESAAETAWKQLKGAIRSVYKFEGYNTSDAEHNRKVYEELPDLLRLMYTLSDIYRLVDMPSKDLEAYEKPRFLKAYNAMRDTAVKTAMSTGNFSAIASKQKMLALGFEPEQVLMITTGDIQNV